MRYVIFLLAGSLWAQNNQSTPLIVRSNAARTVGAEIRICSVVTGCTNYGSIKMGTAGESIQILGRTVTNGNITLQPGDVATKAGVYVEYPRSDTPGLVVQENFAPFDTINFQGKAIYALAANVAGNKPWEITEASGKGILRLMDSSGAGGFDGVGSQILEDASVGSIYSKTVTVGPALATLSGLYIVNATGGTTWYNFVAGVGTPKVIIQAGGAAVGGSLTVYDGVGVAGLAVLPSGRVQVGILADQFYNFYVLGAAFVSGQFNAILNDTSTGHNLYNNGTGGGAYIKGGNALTLESSGSAKAVITLKNTGNGSLMASEFIAVVAPAGACVNGSTWRNTSGGAGTTFYGCEASAWVAK